MDLSDSLPGVRSYQEFLKDQASQSAVNTFNQYHDANGRYYPDGAPGSDIARRNAEYNAARESFQAQQRARQAAQAAARQPAPIRPTGAASKPFWFGYDAPPNPNLQRQPVTPPPVTPSFAEPPKRSFFASPPKPTTGTRAPLPRSVNPLQGGVGNTVTAAKRLPNPQVRMKSPLASVGGGIGTHIATEVGMQAIATATSAAYHQYDTYKRSLTTEQRRKVMLAESVANTLLPTNVTPLGAGLAVREAIGRLLSGEATTPQSAEIAGGEYGSTTQLVDGPLPFTGGQSPGVVYNGAVEVFNIVTQKWEVTQNVGLTGPISSLEIVTVSTFDQRWFATDALGRRQITQNGVRREHARWGPVVRQDGQADTGGDPAPTQVEAPVTTSRPTYKLGTALPSASEATTPAPINLPGLSPSPIPEPPPSGTQAPQEEIPPSALPQNPAAPAATTSPLIDAEGKSTGTAPPAASPGNVPSGVKVGLAAALGTATLIAVGSLVGRPTVSGQTIGSAGEKINDPTKPGAFTTPNQPPPRPPSETPTGNPCGCNLPLMDKLGQIDRKLDAAGLGNAGGEAVSTAAILARLNQMQEFAEKAWKNTHLDKVVNLLTLISVLHNVSMLSREVGETLGYAISNGLAAVGIKDEGGSPLDINEIVGKEVNELVVSIIGQDAYNNLRSTYLKANRILSTGSQIIWTIRSIQDTTQELMEWVGENTGKIGNSLKKFGVVGENAFGWMSERPTAQAAYRRRFDRIIDGLETAEDTASAFATTTSNVLEITEEVAELKQQREAFKQALQDAVPQNRPDNAPVAGAAATAASNAQSPAITTADTDRG